MSGYLNGVPITRGRVQMPAWGLWWADVDLAEPQALSGTATLKFADVTLSGKIVSGGAADGRAAYRIVAGNGGWCSRIAEKSYRNDAGVKLATVLNDAAQKVGETIANLPTTRLGPHYARAEGLASAVLHRHADRAWYVDEQGITRLGSRPTTIYAGEGTRTRREPSSAVIEIATESLATLVPGVRVDGAQPAADVEWELAPKRISARLYCGASLSRRLSAFAALLEALDPLRRYRATYEYRVISQTSDRFDLQPVRTITGMPSLSGVPVRPGVAGARGNVTLGELVLVAFADADPSRPQIIAHDAPDAPGWMPLTIELGGPGALGVARLTDTVVAGPFGGVITSASARVKAVI